MDLLVDQEMHLLGHDSKDMVNMAACACRSMKSIINDTLDFYKMESGFFMIANAPNSLTNLLESTIYSMTPLAKEKGTDVKLTQRALSKTEDSCSSLCLFDFGRLQQVLANLISNAIKFSPHDGTGEVSVSMEIFDDSISIPDVYWQAENTDELRYESSSQSQPTPLLRRNFSSFSDIELEYLLGVDYKIRNIDDFSDDISVLIRVKDNGDGISRKDMEESLFRDFRQLDAGLLSKHKGSGLGLAICLKIVALHHGRIGVRSAGEKGLGSEFFVALRLPTVAVAVPVPVAAKTPDIAPPIFSTIDIEDDSNPTPWLHLRVLVVDDVPSNRKLLSRLLRKQLENSEVVKNSGGKFKIDIQIDEVCDGHLAVELVTGMKKESVLEMSKHMETLTPEDFKETSRSKHFEYDLITMDATMPTMSGYCATKMIRASGYSGSIYGCTGNALESDIKTFIDSGASFVFPKPVSVYEMVPRILADMNLASEV